jgi:hypothetical protein
MYSASLQIIQSSFSQSRISFPAPAVRTLASPGNSDTKTERSALNRLVSGKRSGTGAGVTQ